MSFLMSMARDLTGTSEQLFSSADQVASSAQSLAEAAEESSAAGEELSGQAQALDGSVQQLTALVYGNCEVGEASGKGHAPSSWRKDKEAFAVDSEADEFSSYDAGTDEQAQASSDTGGAGSSLSTGSFQGF